MLETLRSLFGGKEKPAAPDPEAETRLAAAALLVKAAQSDDDYDASEQATIDAALSRMFALSAEDARALREKGEAAAADALDLFGFTHAVKEGVPFEERAAFMTEIWRVVLADGRRDADENALMRKLAGLLYVSDVESGLARQRAEQD